MGPCHLRPLELETAENRSLPSRKSVSSLVLILNQTESANNKAFERVTCYELHQLEEKYCKSTFRPGSSMLSMTAQNPTGPHESCSSKFLTSFPSPLAFPDPPWVQFGSRQTPAHLGFLCNSLLCHLEFCGTAFSSSN